MQKPFHHCFCALVQNIWILCAPSTFSLNYILIQEGITKPEAVWKFNYNISDWKKKIFIFNNNLLVKIFLEGWKVRTGKYIVQFFTIILQHFFLPVVVQFKAQGKTPATTIHIEQLFTCDVSLTPSDHQNFKTWSENYFSVKV